MPEIRFEEARDVRRIGRVLLGNRSVQDGFHQFSPRRVGREKLHEARVVVRVAGGNPGTAGYTPAWRVIFRKECK